jgi:hypothetical protein
MVLALDRSATETSNFMMNIVSKGKGKVFPLLNEAPRHEDVLEGGVTAPCILDFGTRRRWVVTFTLLPLYPQGKRPRQPLGGRLHDNPHFLCHSLGPTFLTSLV